MTTERDDQLHALGSFIRAQRQLANLSLRQMADLAHVSNPYLSQLERGLHEPSVRVLQSIARALNVSAETLLTHAGVEDDAEAADLRDTESAIRSDDRLSDDQKQALLSVYRSYVQANAPAARSSSRTRRAPRRSAGAGRCRSPARPAAHRRARPASRSSRSTTCRGVRSHRPSTRRRRAGARRWSRAAPSAPAGSRSRRCDRPTSSRSASGP